VLLALMATVIVTSIASGQANYKVLHNFTGGADGNEYMGVINAGNWFSSGLVLDPKGVLYGTTAAGGAYGFGVAFALKQGDSGAWTETVLYNFTGGEDGAYPFAGLILDGAGNLYGTTSGGGAGSCTNGYTDGCGVVFELTASADSTWSESVLYRFTGGADGAQPEARLTWDAAGDLYGTTEAGGLYATEACPGTGFSYYFDNGCGVAFELTPSSDGSWSESVLHRFTGGPDGGPEIGPLTIDSAGNLYGSAQRGKNVQGLIFKLAPSQTGWKESILFALDDVKSGADAFSLTGLVFDQAGNLYGTTFWGPSDGGGGVVFKLSPSPLGTWRWSTLHSFGSFDPSAHPVGGVVLDSAGNVYGTDVSGGPGSAGEVFEVTPASSGWAFKGLHAFQNQPASGPFSLILDTAGNLYGTTCCSSNSAGVVFEITR